MHTYEAGISGSQSPDEIEWTGETLEAEDEYQAEILFAQLGFYRNLRVREV